MFASLERTLAKKKKKTYWKNHCQFSSFQLCLVSLKYMPLFEVVMTANNQLKAVHLQSQRHWSNIKSWQKWVGSCWRDIPVTGNRQVTTTEYLCAAASWQSLVVGFWVDIKSSRRRAVSRMLPWNNIAVRSSGVPLARLLSSKYQGCILFSALQT